MASPSSFPTTLRSPCGLLAVALALEAESALAQEKDGGGGGGGGGGMIGCIPAQINQINAQRLRSHFSSPGTCPRVPSFSDACLMRSRVPCPSVAFLHLRLHCPPSTPRFPSLPMRPECPPQPPHSQTCAASSPSAPPAAISPRPITLTWTALCSTRSRSPTVRHPPCHSSSSFALFVHTHTHTPLGSSTPRLLCSACVHASANVHAHTAHLGTACARTAQTLS